jgi:hypothetical protein
MYQNAKVSRVTPLVTLPANVALAATDVAAALSPGQHT